MSPEQPSALSSSTLSVASLSVQSVQKYCHTLSSPFLMAAQYTISLRSGNTLHKQPRQFFKGSNENNLQWCKNCETSLVSSNQLLDPILFGQNFFTQSSQSSFRKIKKTIEVKDNATIKHLDQRHKSKYNTKILIA